VLVLRGPTVPAIVDRTYITEHDVPVDRAVLEPSELPNLTIADAAACPRIAPNEVHDPHDVTDS
jgi:hypothetical protein